MTLKAHTREVLAEHRRGAILRLLMDQPGFALNDGVIQDGLDRVGMSCSRDLVRSELAWLEEQALVSNERIGTLLVSRLTQRGDDVAAGRSSVPGVRRPDPRG